MTATVSLVNGLAPAVLWHNRTSMFRGLVLTLAIIGVGINLPTRAG